MKIDLKRFDPVVPFEWVIRRRWPRVGAALLAGALAALVHPPFGFLPGLIGYPLLMALAERSANTRGAFWMGWLSGFAYFLIGCWWVAEAFFVNPAQAWMGPFAACLLPAGLGLFWGGATAFYRWVRPRTPWARTLLFAALFCGFEWLRGHLLTGFPWNPAGAGWRAGGVISQTASVMGIYGLGLLTIFVAASATPLLDGGLWRRRISPLIAGVVVLALMAGWGFHTLSEGTPSPDRTRPLIRIVQPDIPQDYKWSVDAYASIVERYVALTAQPSTERPDVIVWPEGALPASANQVFAPGAPEAQMIADAMQPGQVLLAGLSRGEPDASAPDGARYYNSLIALTDVGGAGLRVDAIYDKYRLVPFGEFLPLGSAMNAIGLRSLVHMPADFSAGSRPAPIRIPGLPAAQPLICYESLFPGFTPGGAGRPAWIVNVSNDAWFGRTSGPLQHLNLASYRAIETGLPMVRATPTGVSALIDARGRITTGERLEPGESGVLDVRLPEPAPETLYARWGDLPFLALLLVGLVVGAGARLRDRLHSRA